MDEQRHYGNIIDRIRQRDLKQNSFLLYTAADLKRSQGSPVTVDRAHHAIMEGGDHTK